MENEKLERMHLENIWQSKREKENEKIRTSITTAAAVIGGLFGYSFLGPLGGLIVVPVSYAATKIADELVK